MTFSEFKAYFQWKLESLREYPPSYDENTEKNRGNWEGQISMLEEVLADAELVEIPSFSKPKVAKTFSKPKVAKKPYEKWVCDDCLRYGGDNILEWASDNKCVRCGELKSVVYKVKRP